VLLRSWAAGRIKERRPLVGLACFGAAALAWLLLHLGWRAWEMPDVGAPLDRTAFRASVPTGDANLAGQKILAALAEIESPEGKEAVWLARMTEATKLPVGVIEAPSPEGHTSLLRHLPACRLMANRLQKLSEKAVLKGNFETGFKHLAQILTLSRNLRHKAPLESYLAGVQIEEVALENVELLLLRGKPPVELLRQMLTDLDRHRAETPPALDCLRTECYRAGGVFEYPTAWAFYTGPNRIPENWLAGAIAFSLATPWEKERRTRLWQAVWAGLFRAVETPHWQLPPDPGRLELGSQTTQQILRDWLPAKTGPDVSLTQDRLAALLEDSWLADERLYCRVFALRGAGARSQSRVDARRLVIALAIHQVRRGKAAAALADLVPNELAELPRDAYSGNEFGYRISQGEKIEWADEPGFEPPGGPSLRVVPAGYPLVWSTGPDRVDDGGRKHGGGMREDNHRWRQGGYDLVSMAPR
jgi:hypothetical protein